MKTAKEILNHKISTKVWEDVIIDAMQEHTRLHTTHIREELEKLRAENERLKAVNISLEKTIENMAHLEMDTDRQSGQLIIENARYKEVLELVKLDLEERGKEYWDIYKIAKEALKGVTNE